MSEDTNTPPAPEVEAVEGAEVDKGEETAE